MEITRFRVQNLPRTILIVAVVSVCLLNSGNVATAFDFNIDTAHGDRSYGVNRSGTGYQTGDCVHCHDTFDQSICGENELMLFAPMNPTSQTDNFCFQCHQGNGSLQDGGIENYDYSQTFGGIPLAFACHSSHPTIWGPKGILEAFNYRSYHNLNDVLNFAKDKWPTTFTADSNACSACHNVHLAKRNKEHPADPTHTAISRPSDHGNLWGDDADERMSEYYPGHYQAPYYHRSSTYDPGGTSIYDGSSVPDYVSFCTDCHNSTNVIYSSTLERNLRTIDWETLGGESGGDKHGKNVATVGLDIVSPYTASGPLNRDMDFVLSCIDCHEPHGSPSVMLIRREINGDELCRKIEPFDTAYWGGLCYSCHGGRYLYHHRDPNPDLTSPDPPYDDHAIPGCGCHVPGTFTIPCGNCHFHGGDDSWIKGKVEEQYTGRRTF